MHQEEEKALLGSVPRVVGIIALLLLLLFTSGAFLFWYFTHDWTVTYTEGGYKELTIGMDRTALLSALDEMYEGTGASVYAMRSDGEPDFTSGLPRPFEGTPKDHPTRQGYYVQTSQFPDRILWLWVESDVLVKIEVWSTRME